MRRTEARELFMQLLFQMEMQNDYGPSQKERFMEEHMKDKDQSDYFNKMYELTAKHLSEIDALLEECCDRWKKERLAKVDLAVLRLSICEIRYMDDIPNSASINEAVDLAKRFGGEESGKFVNGVLGRVVRGKNGEH
ncbi:transcription antitermination factor NusB [Bacilliculturomica massiliensis]|uniref:transcription antitermination factor NusB n=1 Tax=Bacilliculturomica massiliensis TaxID=1917867 RepID=UPI0013EEECCD|nr:transcription antitermination factor NusB [Bacilliculturomica massiliensis]